MAELLTEALSLTLDPQVWLYVFVGIVLGMFVGAIPGLTATMAVTVLLPIAFYLPPHVGIPFLIAITKGAFYSGSIPAILMSTPGTGAAAATVLDGYPLAKQGKARKALEVSLYGSVVGDIISNIVAIFLASLVASVALKLGPPELVVVMVFGLLLIAFLSGRSFTKGCVAAGLGLLLATIGIDPIHGTSRLTFGWIELSSGIDFIPMVLGLYAVAELLRMGRATTLKPMSSGTSMGERLTRKELVSTLPTMGRATVIGTAVGMLPALNQIVASFLAWSNERRRSSTPEEFGKGSLKGVAATETANNAVNGPSMIPLLSFGIPGDTITAVLLAALLVQGISPGPNIFQEHGPVIYAMFLVFILSSLVLLLVGVVSLKYVAMLSKLPATRMLAAAILFSFVGAYAINYSLFDVVVMMVFGLVGYVFMVLGLPREPLLITFLLAPQIESSLGQALAMDGAMIFVERPVSLGLLGVLVVTLVYLLSRASKIRRMQKAEEDPTLLRK
ncbi:tripartite tricarboxylate transporter permease [Nocardiopsis ansamitocini]|uniref:C4-dicarboxylate ABC transporter permease n=1 Tax=Nocardiopsis ansamitocini TaxID=1670832 RepID=A0A9W6PA51_9ACTN|nr:tripartite tricarboxylate transporter permease [Nocardiopsis ansamitocini]GLU49778.1 C4-dicarboxylate ABC transporter permease [Nocardiopsis ansamitocini]